MEYIHIEKNFNKGLVKMCIFRVGHIIDFVSESRKERIIWIEPGNLCCQTIELELDRFILRLRRIEELEEYLRDLKIIIASEDDDDSLLVEEQIEQTEKAWNIVMFLTDETGEREEELKQLDIFNEKDRSILVNVNAGMFLTQIAG